MKLFGAVKSRRLDQRGRYALIDSLPLSVRQIQSIRGFENIQVDSASDAAGDLSYLIPFADTVRKLIITDFEVTNVSALDQLTLLESLDLFVGRLQHGGGMTSEGLSNLREFSFRYDASLVSVLRRPTLEAVMIENAREDALDALSGATQLRELDLRALKGISAVDISRWPHLKRLQIMKASLPGGFGAGISESNLEKIALVSVRDLPLDTLVALCANVQWIELEDCPDIGTGEWLLELPHLSRLHIIGRTSMRADVAQELNRKTSKSSFPPRLLGK